MTLFLKPVPWSQVLRYLADRLEAEVNQLANADVTQFQRIQGRVQILRELQNLPHTVAILNKEEA